MHCFIPTKVYRTVGGGTANDPQIAWYSDVPAADIVPPYESYGLVEGDKKYEKDMGTPLPGQIEEEEDDMGTSLPGQIEEEIITADLLGKPEPFEKIIRTHARYLGFTHACIDKLDEAIKVQMCNRDRTKATFQAHKCATVSFGHRPYVPIEKGHIFIEWNCDLQEKVRLRYLEAEEVRPYYGPPMFHLEKGS